MGPLAGLRAGRRPEGGHRRENGCARLAASRSLDSAMNTTEARVTGGTGAGAGAGGGQPHPAGWTGALGRPGSGWIAGPSRPGGRGRTVPGSDHRGLVHRRPAPRPRADHRAVRPAVRWGGGDERRASSTGSTRWSRRTDTLVICGDIVMGTSRRPCGCSGGSRPAGSGCCPATTTAGRWPSSTAGPSRSGAGSERRMWQAEYENAWSDTPGTSADRGRGAVGEGRDRRRRPSAWPVPLAGRPVLMSHYPYVGRGLPARHVPTATE